MFFLRHLQQKQKLNFRSLFWCITCLGHLALISCFTVIDMSYIAQACHYLRFVLWQTEISMPNVQVKIFVTERIGTVNMWNSRAFINSYFLLGPEPAPRPETPSPPPPPRWLQFLKRVLKLIEFFTVSGDKHNSGGKIWITGCLVGWEVLRCSWHCRATLSSSIALWESRWLAHLYG